MASTTATSFAGVLKRMYIGEEMFGQICEETPFLDYMKDAGSDRVKHGGAGIYWGTEMSLPGNVGWVAEGGAIPVNTGNGNLPQANSVTKEIVGHVAWTNKQLADSSRGSEAAFMGAQKVKMDGLLKETARSLCIALWGNRIDLTDGTGTTRYPLGVRAQASAASSSTTVTIDNGSPNHFYPGLRLIGATEAEWEGDTADTAGSAATVASVSVDSAGIITLTTVAAWAASGGAEVLSDNDLIVAGDLGAGLWHEYNRALTGLDHIADDAKVSGTVVNDTLFGLSPITYDAWRGVNIDSAGNIARGDVNAFLSLIRGVSGKHPHALFCQERVMDALMDTIDGDVRYMPVTITGGFDREAFKWVAGSTAIPVMEDMWCPMTNLYAVNYDVFQFGYSQEFDWITGDGGQLLRSINSTNFTAAYGAVLESVCFQRNALGVMRGITIDWSKQTMFPS